MSERNDLFRRGVKHITKWCRANTITIPDIVRHSGKEPDFGTCAYYRNGEIHIWVDACATYGRGGRQYSWPGYVVDRTPYGVLAHELGHHVDAAHGPRGGTYGRPWRAYTGEAPLTGYCPNDNEWFAEMFRLFVTNPDLLNRIRPLTCIKMMGRWKPIVKKRWFDVLLHSGGFVEPLRQIRAAENKIKAVRRSYGYA